MLLAGQLDLQRREKNGVEQSEGLRCEPGGRGAECSVLQMASAPAFEAEDLAPGPVNLLAPRQAQKTMYLVSLVVPTEGKVGRTQDLCEKCWKDSHEGNAEREPSELNKRSDGGVQNNLFGDRWLERLFCVKFVEATKELRSDLKEEERQCWVRYMYMVWKQM